jgi:Protein of unknown function (DUF1778)
MALAKKPESNQLLSTSNQITPNQKAFISGSKEIAATEETSDQKSKPVMLRIRPDDLELIDRAAKRVGLKRAAFILSSAVQRASKMES